MHRADFCIAGAFRDLFLFHKTFMPRVLLLLVVLSMVLFEALRRLGLLPLYPFPMLGAISPTHLIGGTLFGIGMVLAGGCVLGTLYRSGAGNLPAMAAVAGLVLGSGLYAEVHPCWAAFTRSSTVFPGKATLPQILAIDPAWLVGLATIPACIVIYRWARAGLLTAASPVEGYIQPWVAAVALAFLGLASLLVSGMPIGITTSYAKAAAWLESGVAFFKTAPLKAVLSSGMSLCGGPGATFDGISLIQFPLIGGIVAGSFVSAVSLGEFRIHLHVPAAQLASGLCGGIVMGIASRMASGCNVWHIMGGLPIFSVPSILFTLGLLPGAWIGGRILTRIV